MSNGYLKISDKLIKNMLNNHQSYRNDIDISRKQTIRDIKDLEDMISAAICPGLNYDSVGGGKTNKIHDPTYESLLRLYSGRYMELIQIKQQELFVLEQREEAFDRVCTAFKKTLWILPREFEIVNRLFYSVEKTTTWDAVSQELGVSKGKISESRKLVYKLVRLIYDSNYKTEDIDGVSEDELYDLVEDSNEDALKKHLNKY